VIGVFVPDPDWVGDINFNDWACQCSNENKHKRTVILINEKNIYFIKPIKGKANLRTDDSNQKQKQKQKKPMPGLICIFWHIFTVIYINNKFLKYWELVNLL
jgi:hypothetical protein